MAPEITLGRYISDERKKRELSQKQLADKCSISPQYLNDIEHDRRSPSTPELLKQFSVVLGLDMDYMHYLLGRLPEDIREKKMSKEEVGEVFRAFRKG